MIAKSIIRSIVSKHSAINSCKNELLKDLGRVLNETKSKKSVIIHPVAPSKQSPKTVKLEDVRLFDHVDRF